MYGKAYVLTVFKINSSNEFIEFFRVFGYAPPIVQCHSSFWQTL